MSEIARRLREQLDAADIDYEILHHAADYRARQTAADTHTPPEEFAKTIFVRIDGDYALVVIPATHSLSVRKLCSSVGAGEVELATEEEMRELCPDCDVGAAPPFGNLYGLPVYVSPLLARREKITFNAGNHRDAVRMDYRHFASLVQPRVVPLSRHEEEAAGA